MNIQKIFFKDAKIQANQLKGNMELRYRLEVCFGILLNNRNKILIFLYFMLVFRHSGCLENFLELSLKSDLNIKLSDLNAKLEYKQKQLLNNGIIFGPGLCFDYLCRSPQKAL